MIDFAGRVILLDVEGTTSSVAFVTQVLFPSARRELNRFLRERWNDAEVAAAREQIARDTGAESLEDWVGGPGLPPEYILGRLREEVTRLMDDDAKTTGLKMLQGLIWRDSFETGRIKAHVYSDVPPAFDAWRRRGKRLAIYSSGSVLAQRLFFSHTEEGDLTPYLEAYFDTTSGPKREMASYTTIADQLGVAPAEVLFLSDVAAELNAARGAGMRTALVVRGSQGARESAGDHPSITSFDEINVE